MRDSNQSTDNGDPPPRNAARMDGARVVVLGANAWVVLAVLPMLFAEPRGAGSLAMLLLPLPPLLAGALLLERTPIVAGWVLLGGFPTLLAAVVAVLPRLVLQDAYSSMGLLLGVLSLVAYGAGAVFAAMRPPRLRSTRRKPLGSVSPIDEPAARLWTRRLLLVAGTLGALAVAVVAPSMGGPAAYEQAWGSAAPEAAVLTAVVGGALGTAILAFFVAPALRAPRGATPTRRQVDRRIAALLVSVAIGVAFYWFYVVRG